MRIIAHRANLYGPKDDENTQKAITRALSAGFDVEVDIWYAAPNFYLGHDKPGEKINLHNLMDSRIWCHAKSPKTFIELAKYSKIQAFFQGEDDISLTTNGYFWCHSKSSIDHPKAIRTALNWKPQSGYTGRPYGICTDYPLTTIHAFFNLPKPGIKLIILDIDGVMTPGYKEYGRDGKVISKIFADKDFTAIKRFQAAGIIVVFLSGDPMNEAMANSRRIPFYTNNFGSQDKSEFLPQFMDKFGVLEKQIAFVGDDYYDLRIIENLEHTYCPLDAISDVKERVKKVLPVEGGKGVIAALYDELRGNIPDVFPFDSPEVNRI